MDAISSRSEGIACFPRLHPPRQITESKIRQDEDFGQSFESHVFSPILIRFASEAKVDRFPLPIQNSRTAKTGTNCQRKFTLLPAVRKNTFGIPNLTRLRQLSTWKKLRMSTSLIHRSARAASEKTAAFRRMVLLSVFLSPASGCNGLQPGQALPSTKRKHRHYSSTARRSRQQSIS